MTLEQVAKQLNTSKSVISKIELGHRNYNRTNLEGLSEVLRCEPWDLISRPPDATESRRFDGLSPETRKVIAEIMRRDRG
jgi:transcriptional regulator with XRE-family HTH domain